MGSIGNLYLTDAIVMQWIAVVKKTIEIKGEILEKNFLKFDIKKSIENIKIKPYEEIDNNL